MDLKKMIAELNRVRQHPCINGDGEEALMSAAEALALVAWAEEKKAGIDYLCGTWYCGVGDEDAFAGKTFLGCIRAAKEAYEKEK